MQVASLNSKRKHRHVSANDMTVRERIFIFVRQLQPIWWWFIMCRAKTIYIKGSVTQQPVLLPNTFCSQKSNCLIWNIEAQIKWNDKRVMIIYFYKHHKNVFPGKHVTTSKRSKMKQKFQQNNFIKIKCIYLLNLFLRLSWTQATLLDILRRDQDKLLLQQGK